MKPVLPLLFVLVLAACVPRPLHVAGNRPQRYTVDSTIPSDPALIALIAPYRRGVDTLMQEVIGRTDIPLTKAQPECLLGNFIADASLEAARRIDPSVDGAVMNYGSIRVPMITPGPITRAKLVELMPFDNRLCIIEIPGTVLQQFCDHIAAARGWPLSGIRFVIAEKHATGIRINSRPLETSRVYRVAVNDYLANGGDNCAFLRGLPRQGSELLLRDILTGHLAVLEAAGKPLHPTLEDRITYAE